jgi:hypothetical protein
MTMADNPLSILDPLRNFFAAGLSGKASLFANIIVSTIIGGIVLLLIVKILGAKWGENVSAKGAFLAVFFVNLINIFGVIGIIGTYISFFPPLLLILPLLIWIGIFKLLFSEMSAAHLIITAVIGYFVSIFAVPYLLAIVLPLLPLSSLPF